MTAQDLGAGPPTSMPTQRLYKPLFGSCGVCGASIQFIRLPRGLARVAGRVLARRRGQVAEA